MTPKFGNTWWGRQWLQALTKIDFSNRIPRGATYARAGRVSKLQIKDGKISANVQGSLFTAYKEEISLKKFTAKESKKIIEIVSGQPFLLSRLVSRELDESLARLVDDEGIDLFPTSWRNLKMKCSCPDSAVPCKHLAAVIYQISSELDNDPLLLFKLHGLDLLAELEKRGLISQNSQNVMQPEDFRDVFSFDNYRLEEDKPFPEIDYTTLPDWVDQLPMLLKPQPAFCPSGDFRSEYSKTIKRIAKAARKCLETHGASIRNNVGMWDFGRPFQLIAYSEATLHHVLAKDPEELRDLHPSYLAIYGLMRWALQLIAHGCIVPQIYADRVHDLLVRYTIIWHPACIDEATRNICSQLPHTYDTLCSLLTNTLILISDVYSTDLLKMFFNGQRPTFSKVGERQSPGSIMSWLSIFHVRNSHTVAFKVDEASDAAFSVDVAVDGLMLRDLLADGCDMGILSQLSAFSDAVPWISEYINDRARHSKIMQADEFSEFLFNVMPMMRLLGVDVILPRSLQQLVKPKVTMSLKTKGNPGEGRLSLDDILDFDWEVAIGDESITAQEFEKLVGKTKGLFKFKENYVYMSEADVQRLCKALNEPPKLKGGDLLQVALSGDYLDAPVQITPAVSSLIQKFTAQADVPLPEGLNAELREYQKRGYSWMYRNMRIGFGSVIADDMGLGKTIQVIALLLKMSEEGALNKDKKAIVVVPTGLLQNWEQEIARFAPSISTSIYHGPLRNLDSDPVRQSQVLITTYGAVRSDIEKLKKMKFQAMVIDEAQNIKNSDTAQTKAIAQLKSNVRIAMSGTPVENRLQEFWSIMNFANKGYLGSQKDFAERYARPIQNDGDRIVADRFRKVTAPFMMRRLKSDKSIISDLPDKVERNEFVSLTPDQTALYAETVNRCMDLIRNVDGSDRKNLFKRQGLILQMILALKQICNHPTHFLKDGRMDPSLSGKVVMLLDMLRSIVEAKEKVLIFTQFKEMGDLLVNFVKAELGTEPMFYHGGCTVKKRSELVDRFQNNPADRIFILSLKAAGTGLNLTAATHVIHFDLWWNPAVEAQATDRAYRIGQHKNVQVHRFITKDTFEEKIDAIIQQKRDLVEMTVSTGENWIGNLSDKELEEIFG